MQGRLSPLTDGRTQSFPWSYWQEEFPVAARLGFRFMEWTLDQERIYENPLLTATGQADIKSGCRRYGLAIPSMTGDCFMQAPFWKVDEDDRAFLQRDFRAVAEACAAVGIAIIVVPLVDNGHVETTEQEDVLVTFLQSQLAVLGERGLRVAFESDSDPETLARFIGRLDPACFGINYDIGNSAASGFDPVREMAAYGSRVLNVHVKDRVRDGATVPLGTGHADFEAAFAALHDEGYCGAYVLQTARAVDDDHVGVLCRYRDMTVDWLSRHVS